MKQLVLDLIPPPAPTLANFVVGRNIEALAALRGQLAPATGLVARILYLWGVAGSGKTHLIEACLGAGYAPLTEPAGDDSGAAHHVAVDAVQTLGDTSQQALFDLINRQQMTSGLLIATGNAAPRDLTLRRDLASRLGSGLVYQLHPLSDAEKADALQAHAHSRGFLLRDDVITYLLRHSRRDMASLIQMLDALDRYSLETGREITLPLLKEMSQPSLV
ncbi:MAG: DnaA regulatory inactivator Hda [Betaproteobacteria bacterium]